MYSQAEAAVAVLVAGLAIGVDAIGLVLALLGVAGEFCGGSGRGRGGWGAGGWGCDCGGGLAGGRAGLLLLDLARLSTTLELADRCNPS